MFQIRSEQFAAMRRKKIGDTVIERLAPFVTASWDAQQRQVLLRDGLGARGALSFDVHGFIGAYISPLGRAWQLTNQTNGQLLSLVSPSAHTLSMAYTPDGLVSAFATTTQAQINLFYERRHYVASQYADGTAETVQYTRAGDPTLFTNRLGHQVLCQYDDFRRMTSVTDANGHSTQFLYDRWNRPGTILHPNGQHDVFTYNDEGRISHASWAESGSAEVESDVQGRPLRLAYSDGLQVEFSYNDAGLLTQASSAGEAQSFEYSDDGQFVQEIAGSYKHSLAYDAGKRLASVTSLGATVQFRYDADSRLTGFTDWSGGEHLIEYLPGDSGQVTTGPRTETAAGVRSFLRTDTAGRLASLQVVAGGETPFFLTCSYDVESRLSTSTDSAVGQRAFSYDADSRLLYADATHAGSRESFAYDRAGNLAAVNATRMVYDSANQLLEAGKTTLRWDDRGNLIEITAPEGAQRFRYNVRNQLVASVADNGVETTYAYDALGRRTAKRTGGLETRFFWAGEQMLCEIRADLLTGELRRQDYLYHPETGVPLATAVDGEVFTIHTDHLGTPRALTATTGEVVWLAEFSSYGMARVTVERIPMPLRFRGQYHDPETGLHYNRFRYYAPQWGRYISRDPLTFAAGTNHYLYVNANPLNESDATGLIGWKGFAALAVGAAVGAVVGVGLGLVLGPGAIPLAILAGGIAAGAVTGGLNEALNEKHFCLTCIARAAGLGALAGAVGSLPFMALPLLGLTGLMALGGAAGAGLFGGALSYGVSCLDGAVTNPSWSGLAASAGTGMVFGAAGEGVGGALRVTPEEGTPPLSSDSASSTDDVPQVTKNAAAGRDFENQGLDHLQQTQTDVQSQVSVRPYDDSGNLTPYRVRLDAMGSDSDGNLHLTDFKSSDTAGFTPNQDSGYPLIERNGGQVVGNNGGASYPAGFQIPPTPVDILRPGDF